MMAQRNNHSIVSIRPMEIAPLSRCTQLQLDQSDDELYLHEAVARTCNQTASRIYNNTARTVREDLVRDAAQEVAHAAALGPEEHQLLRGLRQVYGLHHAVALQNRLDRIQEVEEIYTTPPDPGAVAFRRRGLVPPWRAPPEWTEMVMKAAAGVFLALIWLALVGLGIFVLTLGFLGAGVLWGRSLGRRDGGKVIDQLNRRWALQTELRHIERDHDHENQCLSGWYHRAQERIIDGW